MHARHLVHIQFALAGLVTLAGDAGAQGQGVHFSVPNNSVVSSSPLLITITACTPWAPTDYGAWHGWSGGSANPAVGDGAWVTCDPGLYASGYNLELNLEIGQNTLYFWASDYTGWPSFEEGNSLTVTYEDPNAPMVSVIPAAAQVQAIAGQLVQWSLSLFNPRNTSAWFDLQVTCSGAATCSGLSYPSSVYVPSMTTITTAANFSGVGAVGAVATLNVTATQSGMPSHTGSASGTFQVIPNGPATNQALCLTMPAGSNAAYECGALRVVHPLPAVRTISSVRAPTLTYNSLQAHPYPIVSTTATLPGGSATPDSVVTTVVMNGVPYRHSVPGSQFPAGQARRAMVPIDAVGLSTGLYSYTIEVKRFTGLGSAILASESGALPIVNRATSAFGAGWWLAGYEELQSLSGNRMLWIGGDGSTKVYEQVSATAQQVVYMAARQAYSDSLVKNVSNNTWTRRLPSGGAVGFNSSLRHVTTTSRLGHVTTFTQDGSGRLATIAVPPTASGLSYTFVYTSSKLDSIIAPDTAIAVKRVTQVTVDGSGRLTQIVDPGLPPVVFTYDGSVTRHIVQRTDRRGGLTRFGYDTAHRVASSAVKLAAMDSSKVTYCAGESMGITVCQATLVAPSEVRTIVDGARTDVPDVTTFWIDGTGAPTRVQDAMGSNTYIARSDARFPVLPTRTQTADGRIASVSYDHRGNPLALIDSSLVVGGQRSTTLYEWHPYWNLPTVVASPAGTQVRRAYDGSTGNVLWEEDKRGASSRTTFVYDASGLLRFAQKPGGARDSLYYDSLRWNVSAVRTPTGQRTDFLTDRLGRVTVSKVALGSGLTQDDSARYDQRGRVVRSVSYGPSLHGQPPQLIEVNSTFDVEGNPLSVTRTMSPNPWYIQPLTTSWSYDIAGRQVKQVSAETGRDSSVYDNAGNLVMRVTARRDTLYFRYDTLGRLTRRIATAASDLPAVFRLGASEVDTARLLNTPYGGFVLEPDTTTFAYDVMGRLTSAANRDARVKRTYTAHGALDRDSLWIRTWARDAEHAYGIRYEYDIAGRIKTVWYPTQLVVGTLGKATYTYDATTGFLSQVHGLQSEQFDLAYNDNSELAQLSMPGGIIETNSYDDDGRLALHRIRNNTPLSLADRFPADWIDSTRVRYNVRGQVDSTINRAGPRDTRAVKYTGLGHLYQNRLTANGVNMNQDTVTADVTETFTHDALGNVLTGVDNFLAYYSNGLILLAGAGMQASISNRTYVYDATTGRVNFQSRSLNLQSFRYDSAGNTVLSSLAVSPQSNPYAISEYDDRFSVHNAAGQVVYSERRVHRRQYPLSWEEASDLQRFEEWYRYDPLGRRVLVRATSSCNTHYNYYRMDCNLGQLRRTVWMGDRELVEIQRPVDGIGGGTVSQMENDISSLAFAVRPSGQYQTVFDPNPAFGRVAYTHGLGVDRPLSVTRFGYVDRNLLNTSHSAHAWPTFTLVPHWNMRGEAQTGTLSTGAAQFKQVVSGVTRWARIDWPLGALAYNRLVPGGRTFGGAWQGTLIQQKLDAVGTLYRRNRYYDPGTGRFTQPDPIGLAGGLNLYGYAGGDPINFSDPFGLCPRVTVDGDNVLIEANLETSGLAPADVTRVAQGIQQIWGGRRGGMNVTVNLNVADAPVVEVFTTTNPGGQGLSRGYLGGGQMSVPVAHGAGVTRTAAAHEFGHVMGLGHDASNGNLMNTSIDAGNPSNRRVTRAQMQQAIKNCATPPKEGAQDDSDNTANPPR